MRWLLVTARAAVPGNSRLAWSALLAVPGCPELASIHGLTLTGSSIQHAHLVAAWVLATGLVVDDVIVVSEEHWSALEAAANRDAAARPNCHLQDNCGSLPMIAHLLACLVVVFLHGCWPFRHPGVGRRLPTRSRYDCARFSLHPQTPSPSLPWLASWLLGHALGRNRLA